MAEEQSSSKSFFTTLPGLITAIAGLITAVGGFILILNKTGCFRTKVDSAQHQVNVDSNTAVIKNHDKQLPEPLNTGNVSYSPSVVKHLTKNLNYKIEEVVAKAISNRENVLTIKLKCSNNSEYEYHFYSTFIGVLIDEDRYGPEYSSPSGNYVSIPPKGFKRLEYYFRVPKSYKSFHFVLYDVDGEIGRSVFTPR